MKRILLALLLIAAFDARAQEVVPLPPTGFFPLNASEADLQTYHVPPMPIGPGTDAARAAWLRAMPYFSNRKTNVTFGSGPALAPIKISPNGIGTCTASGTSCTSSTPTTFVNPVTTAPHVTPTVTLPATTPKITPTVTIGKSSPSPAAVGSSCGSGKLYTAVSVSGQTQLQCVALGGVCYCAPANCGTIGDATNNPGDLTGAVNGQGICVPNSGQACTTAGGQAGTTNGTGGCSGSGGGTNPPTNGPAFTTPTLNPANQTTKSGVVVYPTTPSQFTSSAMLIEFTLPTTMTNADANNDSMAVWVGTQPSAGGSIAQAGVVSTAGANTWTPVYAFNTSGSSITISGPALSPGDKVMVEMWNTSATQAWVYVADETTGLSSLTSAPAVSVVWTTELFGWIVENASGGTYDTPNFHSLTVSATSIWNTTGATGNALPTGPQSVASQYVVEANGYSAAPTYGTFSGSSQIWGMLGFSGACCSVSAAVSGTGGITFTRSQTVN